MNRAKNKGKKEVKASDGISIVRFGVTYLILMGAFFFLIGFAPITRLIDLNGSYTQGVVAATVKLLEIMGVSCAQNGSLIQLPSITLDVKFGCNGLEAVMIYSVAVVAFPSSWKKKVLGILAGLALLQVLNILRIAALAYSGVHFRSLFEYIHVYVAQGLMIAAALGIFFVYLNYAGKRKTSPA